MSWTTFTLRTTTPLFLGAEAIPRVSSLRGALRFWFRGLVGTRVGNDIDTLRTLESTVFGSLEHPATVRMRIPHPPEGTPAGAIDRVLDVSKAEAQWIAYLLGQGHAKVETAGPKLHRPFLPANTAFRLKMRFSGERHVDALIVGSLWLLCTYGGLGARTRRGFGGLRITGVEGAPLPAPWTPETVVTPGLDYYQGLTSLLPDSESEMRSVLDATLNLLPAFGLTLHPLADRPDYPTVSDTFTAAALSEFSGTTWSETAAWIGERYRHFRAPEDNEESKTTYSPKIKTQEYQAFTEPGHHLPGPRKNEFPLGAFGLPVLFKNRIQVNATSGGPLRRASPMWIRLVHEGETWRVFSFAFHNEYFASDPKAPRVTVNNASQGPRELLVPNKLVEDRTAAWLAKVREP